MPISVRDEATLVAQILAFFRARFPSKNLSDDAFLGKVAAAFGAALLGIEQAVLAADRDAIPSQDSSDAAVDLWANVFGLSNGAGGIGRKGAVAASGGLALCAGTNGIGFPAGSLLTASDGVTIIKLNGAVTVPGSPPGSGSIQGSFSAVTPGPSGNLSVGSLLQWQSAPSGATKSVTLTTALKGGQPEESTAALLGRLFDHLQNPPKGGTAADYRAWAESIDGIDRAYVYPHRSGLGSVDVFITQAGSGASRKPSTTLQAAVDAYIDSQRPAGMDGYESLLGDYSPALVVRVRVKAAQTKYKFDWDDTATDYSVDTLGYSAGPPATLKLNTSAPQTLKDAIAAAIAGPDVQSNGPRIQVGITGGPAVPLMARAVAIAMDNVTLTLQDSLPDAWVATPPSPGDVVFAGGPMNQPIAQAVLDYVDSLGPSTQSGYQDARDAWEDEAAIARITEIAIGTKDTDGSRFASNLAIVDGGVTIDDGVGGPLEQDVEGLDNTSDGPQVLTVTWIFVTQ